MSRKLMNLRATLAVLFAAFVWSVSAQTVTITGTVTDETGGTYHGCFRIGEGYTCRYFYRY